MKLSISWILDHISTTKHDIDIDRLVKQFNATTAEIEGVDHIRTDLANLFAVRITEMFENDLLVMCPELGKSFCLPARKDSFQESGTWYLIKQEGKDARWATLADVGSTKDGLLVGLSMNDTEAHGAWRDKVEQDDTIITIDNKAITNRPDLWGHRGCAREVAALLGKELVLEEKLLADTMIKHFDKKAPAGVGQSFSLALDDEACGSTL